MLFWTFDKNIINLFFEDSTRTLTSFELAGKQLGASVINMSIATSSIKKGETLIDTGRGLPLCASPVSNSMVTIKNKVPHKVCAVTGPNKRKVLQFRGVFYE